MGETSDDAVFDQVLGAAEAEAAPASAPGTEPADAQAAQPAQVQETEETDDRVEPVLARLAAGQLRPNDAAMLRRWHEGQLRAKDLETRVRELENPDLNRLYADRLMAGFTDPQVLADHKAWRQQYGDDAYVRTVLRQQAEDAEKALQGESEGAQPDPQQFAAAVQKAVQQALEPWMPVLQASQAERYARDASQAVKELGVPEHAHAFLIGYAKDRLHTVAANVSLADHIRNCWQQVVKPLLDSQAKATGDRLRVGTRPARPAPSPKEGIAPPEVSEADDIDSVIDGSLSTYEDKGGAG